MSKRFRLICKRKLDNRHSCQKVKDEKKTTLFKLTLIFVCFFVFSLTIRCTSISCPLVEQKKRTTIKRIRIKRKKRREWRLFFLIWGEQDVYLLHFLLPQSRWSVRYPAKGRFCPRCWMPPVGRASEAAHCNQEPPACLSLFERWM